MKNATNELGGRIGKKLFNFRPALFVAVFLLFGILFAYYRILYGASYLWTLPLLFVLLVPLFFSGGFSDFLLRLGTLTLLAACFCVGVISFRSQIIAYQDLPAYHGEYVVLGEVESRKIKDEKAKLVLKNVTIGEEGTEGRLVAYLPVYQLGNVGVGDKVLLRGNVETSTKLMDEYEFRSSDVTKKAAYILTSDEACMKVGRSKDPFLLVRARMEEVVYANMDETPAGLTIALLTGDINGVDGELMENMRKGGIAHIFAVSGLNVGALFGCCLFLFSRPRLKGTPKAVRFLLLVGILFFYCGVCGFSASVVRAAITCAVCYFAKLLGVGNDLLNALGIAAILILLISPAELFGVGFQLSFLACLGLFLLMKPTTQVFDEIRKVYLKRFPRKYTAEEEKLLAAGDTLPPTIGEEVWRGATTVLSASIAAQLMTLPALLLHFNYLSGWSLLLNFIFVPITDALFTILLLFVSICCFLPTSFGSVLLYIPSVLWSAAILVFQAADFSTFGIENLQLSFPICVCYYGGILLLTDKLNLTPRMRKRLAIAFWCFFAVGLHLHNL